MAVTKITLEQARQALDELLTPLTDATDKLDVIAVRKSAAITLSCLTNTESYPQWRLEAILRTAAADITVEAGVIGALADCTAFDAGVRHVAHAMHFDEHGAAIGSTVVERSMLCEVFSRANNSTQQYLTTWLGHDSLEQRHDNYWWERMCAADGLASRLDMHPGSLRVLDVLVRDDARTSQHSVGRELSARHEWLRRRVDAACTVTAPA